MVFTLKLTTINKKKLTMPTISEIRTGGQSGVDRGAMDASRVFGVPISGWCPLGGWAEDYTEPPGLLVDYPELVECNSAKPIVRTELNIRDSSACIVLNAKGKSAGTDAGFIFFEKYGIPYLELNLLDMFEESGFVSAVNVAVEWLSQFSDDNFILGVGGSRESEVSGCYNTSYNFVSCILQYFDNKNKLKKIRI